MHENSPSRVLGRFVVFGLMGLAAEAWYTGVLHGGWSAIGRTSPWMMLDYGLLGVALMWLARPMIRRGIPLPLRAVVYMAAIFFVEWASGWGFWLIGVKIWDYSHLPYNLHGYTSAVLIPVWYVVALPAEYLYKRVDACVVVFLRNLSADDLPGGPAAA